MQQKICVSKRLMFLSVTAILALTGTFIFSSVSKQKVTQQTKAAPHKIYGGSNVAQGKHPYMAGIYVKENGKVPYATTDGKTYNYDLKSKVLCGGTLVNRQYIITASHCMFYNTAEDPYKLVAYTKDTLGIILDQVNLIGPVTLDSSHPTIASFFPEIEWIKTKPDISQVTEPDDIEEIADTEDIALIKLKNPVSIVSAELPSDKSAYANGSSITILGYGYTAKGSPSQLQYLITPIVGLANGLVHTGKDMNGWAYFFTSIFAPGSLQGVCNRDSGGPLLYTENDKETLVGIVVRGNPHCGSSIEYSLEVRSVLPWIQANL